MSSPIPSTSDGGDGAPGSPTIPHDDLDKMIMDNQEDEDIEEEGIRKFSFISLT